MASRHEKCIGTCDIAADKSKPERIEQIHERLQRCPHVIAARPDKVGIIVNRKPNRWRELAVVLYNKDIGIKSMLKNLLDEKQVIAIQIHADDVYLVSPNHLKATLHDLDAIITRHPLLCEPKL